MSKVSKPTQEWLQARFDSNQNGIILDEQNYGSFEIIQNFLEGKEDSVETPAIYYSAFARESAAEFIDTLLKELSCKLSKYRINSYPTPSEKIAAAGLKMVIIDRSYRHPIETTERLLAWFDRQGVSLVLVGSQAEMNRAQYLNHPRLNQLPLLLAGHYRCVSAAC